MCAKKATPPAPRKPAPAKSAKSTANGKVVSLTATPTSKVERTLSAHDIGSVAGEVWGLLADGEGQSLAALKKAVAAPPDVVVAAVGWLAREHKLEFTTSGRTQKIALKA